MKKFMVQNEVENHNVVVIFCCCLIVYSRPIYHTFGTLLFPLYISNICNVVKTIKTKQNN